MTHSILEIATFKLAEGVEEAALLEASAQLERDFLAQQPGFLRRELVRKGAQTYADIILWHSQEQAQAAVAKAQANPAAGGYFSLMSQDPADMRMEHAQVLVASGA